MESNAIQYGQESIRSPMKKKLTGSLIQTSRLSISKQEKLMELFVAGSTARTAAALVDVNKSTAAYYFHRLREMIDKEVSLSSSNVFEINVNYFKNFFLTKSTCKKVDNLLIFAIIKNEDKLHTKMVSLTEKEDKQIDNTIIPDSIVFFDSTEKSEFLDITKLKQCRITQGEAENTRTINDFENFWGQAKRQLRKYNGIPRNKFHLFLKECEWRYNYNSPKQQLMLLNTWANKTQR